MTLTRFYAHRDKYIATHFNDAQTTTKFLKSSYINLKLMCNIEVPSVICV